jgi:hypothetical protein
MQGKHIRKKRLKNALSLILKDDKTSGDGIEVRQ